MNKFWFNVTLNNDFFRHSVLFDKFELAYDAMIKYINDILKDVGYFVDDESVEITLNHNGAEINVGKWGNKYVLTMQEGEFIDSLYNLTLLRKDDTFIYFFDSKWMYQMYYKIYDEGDYFPCDIYGAMSCIVTDGKSEDKYFPNPMSDKKGGFNFVCLRVSSLDIKRLIKINPQVGGICLCDKMGDTYEVVSVEKLRDKGFAYAINEDKQTFEFKEDSTKEKETITLFGRDGWELENEFPEREYIWKVGTYCDVEGECEIWMDNTYGDMWAKYNGKVYNVIY